MRAPRTYAFSLVEILVSVGVLALISALVFGAISRARAAQRSTDCLSRMRAITQGFHLYAQTFDNRLPDPGIGRLSWEQLLLPYYRGKFDCPSDTELAPVIGSSYDWRDTGDPSTTFAGRSLSEKLRSDAVLVFDALPGWHSKRRMNAGFLDGSARSMGENECLKDLTDAVVQSGAASNFRRWD